MKYKVNRARKIIVMAAFASAVLLTGCQTDASKATHNLSRAAEQFEVQRNIVFYNTMSDKYMLQVEGKCSTENKGHELQVICKTGNNQFARHSLGLSRNVSYFVEQLEALPVSVYHTRIIWKPQSIIPDIDINSSADDLVETLSR